MTPKVSIFPYEGGYRGKAPYKGPDGKTKYKPIRGRTIREVKKKVVAFYEARELEIPESGMTVDQMCGLAIARAREHGRADNTVRGYEGYRSTHIAPRDRDGRLEGGCIGLLKVTELRSYHVERMMAGMDTSRQTKLLVRAFLRMAINKVAYRAGIVERNEASIADPPPREREKRRKKPRLTTEAVELIFQTEPNPVRRCLYLLIGTTGLRISEALNLTWHEVTKREDGVWIELDKSKTPKGLDPVPVPEATWREIEKLGKVGVCVFPSKVGRSFTYYNFRRAWVRTLAKAGLEYTNPYKLRHYFGSMKARHVTEAVLGRLMRHEDPRTSQQFYVEPFDSELREAAERQ